MGDFFANGVEAARKRVESVEAEAGIANNAASIALVDLQEAILEVREGCETLRLAQKKISQDSEQARRARDILRVSQEHANTANERVTTLKELLRKRKETLMHSES